MCAAYNAATDMFIANQTNPLQWTGVAAEVEDKVVPAEAQYLEKASVVDTGLVHIQQDPPWAKEET